MIFASFFLCVGVKCHKVFSLCTMLLSQIEIISKLLLLNFLLNYCTITLNWRLYHIRRRVNILKVRKTQRHVKHEGAKARKTRNLTNSLKTRNLLNLRVTEMQGCLSRVVFRTQSKRYDGASLRKQLTLSGKSSDISSEKLHRRSSLTL